ncbi:MAG: sulfatase [Planctomycetota bacterium]|jgi:arylsulfatase A-like enzyme
MIRRDFVGTVAWGLLLPLVAAGVAPEVRAQNRRPNIVLIVSDDQGYADASYHHHPKEVSTPNIDRLARQGVQFTDGYASAWVCAPTRAGLVTGRYQQRFGFYMPGDSSVGLPPDEVTIADVLKRAGYATGVFGKWHLGTEPRCHPLRRGFGEFYGFLGRGAHDYFNLKRDPDNLHNAIYRNDTIIDDTGYLTDNLAREAVAFIQRRRQRPFFLYLPFNAVHWPLQAPAEDVKLFDTGDENRDVYLAMLRRMDLAVGRVLQALEQTGLDGNTLLFFFSDNGGARKNFADNAPLRDYKQSVYEGGIRVPFIVRWPGELPKGTVCREPVICLDIMPTICAAVGADLPGDRIYDGKNLLPLLRGEAKGPLHEALFWHGASTQWGVRMGKWKLLTNRQGALELYDLRADVGETTNLARGHPEIVKRLRQAYTQWKSEMAPQLNKSAGKKPKDRIRPRQRRQKKEENDQASQ